MSLAVCGTLAAAAQVPPQTASALSRVQALRHEPKPATRSLSDTAGSASHVALE
ncbi:hypothetical protein D3C72_2483590 [compost metagenome]